MTLVVDGGISVTAHGDGVPFLKASIDGNVLSRLTISVAAAAGEGT